MRFSKSEVFKKWSFQNEIFKNWDCQKKKKNSRNHKSEKEVSFQKLRVFDGQIFGTKIQTCTTNIFMRKIRPLVVIWKWSVTNVWRWEKRYYDLSQHCKIAIFFFFACILQPYKLLHFALDHTFEILHFLFLLSEALEILPLFNQLFCG